MTEIVGILLAAGAARRFGSPKLLCSLPGGVPVGIASARTLVQSVTHTLAVVKPDDRALIEAYSAIGLEIVKNPLANDGMGTSLAAGISAAPGASGWLIALADMPWIQPATVRMLADTLRSGASMVAPVFGGRRGHPVGFSQQWGNRLQALSGDDGARSLIAEHADKLVLLETLDVGVLNDVDYLDDLIPEIGGS